MGRDRTLRIILDPDARIGKISRETKRLARRLHREAKKTSLGKALNSRYNTEL